MEINNIKALNGDCLELIKSIPDNSIDTILTDPPYLYLKNQKLERVFDENAFFNECKRVLREYGFIVLFGRGTSFYRWNTTLNNLGFTFKEEIVWDKGHCTSPLMALSRIHETISIHTKKTGKIKKTKVPYLLMKAMDFAGIKQDIKRLLTTLKNIKSLNAVLNYIENNIEKQKQKREDFQDSEKFSKHLQVSSEKRKGSGDRCVNVLNSIEKGMNEKSIIREHEDCAYPSVSVSSQISKVNRCVSVINSIEAGMNEKSIIKQVRDHYTYVHPTQKPVKLLERLLNITTEKDAIVLDPFAGSFSTAEACYNTGRTFIGFEIDNEYYNLGVERIKSFIKSQLNLF